MAFSPEKYAAGIDLLAAKLQQYDLSEVELADGDVCIRVAKGVPAVVSATAPTPAPVGQNGESAAVSATTAPTPAPVQPAAGDAAAGDKLVQVKAPLLGVAYTSKDPDSPAFVEVGSQVKAGDTICLVEAMKVFNEISAPVAGTIHSIDFQNGDMVEYDQLLLTIEP
jgi:acetyl-CoA carboxylase biotin carboxyl carrier protein